MVNTVSVSIWYCVSVSYREGVQFLPASKQSNFCYWRSPVLYFDCFQCSAVLQWKLETTSIIGLVFAYYSLSCCYFYLIFLPYKRNNQSMKTKQKHWFLCGNHPTLVWPSYHSNRTMVNCSRFSLKVSKTLKPATCSTLVTSSLVGCFFYKGVGSNKKHLQKKKISDD